MSKLSIITINYNNANGLKRTIESVIEQTFKDIEYIIVDGGSTDESLQFIKQYQHKINYWVSEKDNGIYPAMNKGAKAATGNYLLFLNSGDELFDKNVLFAIIHELDGTDIVYGNVMNFKSDGSKWLQKYSNEISLFYLGYCWNSLPHQAMFIKRALFQKFGYYDEKYKMVADWAFYMKAIFVNNCTYKYVDQIVSLYNFEGFSSDKKNELLQKKEREQVLDEYFRNHHLFFQNYEAMTWKLWSFEKSRIIRFLRKVKLLRMFS